MDKVPCSARGTAIGVDRRENFITFEDALAAYEERGILHGIGFALKGAQLAREGGAVRILALDFDHCVDEHGKIDEAVCALLEALRTYAELSPSGRGVRAFLAVRGPFTSFKGERLQVFSDGGFVTVTGHVINAEWTGVRVHPAARLEKLFADWRPAPREALDLGERPADVGADVLPDEPDWFAVAAGAVLEAEDRSSALAALCAQALRLAPPEVVLWWVHASPAFQVALDHRRQDEERALDYVWRHHCSQDVVRASADDFEDLDGGDGAGPTGHGTEEGFSAGSLLAPAGDLASRAAPAEWIVHGLIERNQVVLLVAEESTGKTFVALDIARCVASGARWGDFETTPGPVGYFSAEGPSGFLRRLTVLEHHKGSLEGLFAHAGVLSLTMSVERRLRLTDSFRAIAAEVKARGLVMVFLDTFSAYKGDAEENSNTEMSWLLAMSRKHIVEPTGCTVVWVHHTRKEGDVFRGASALSNNSDVRLELTRGEAPGRLVFSAPRLRDSAAVGGIHLRLTPARVGDITSLIVEPVSVEEAHQEEVATGGVRKDAIKGRLAGRDDNPPSAYTVAQELRAGGARWARREVVEGLLKEMEDDEEVARVRPANARGQRRADRWVLVVLPEDPEGLLT